MPTSNTTDRVIVTTFRPTLDASKARLASTSTWPTIDQFLSRARAKHHGNHGAARQSQRAER